MGEFGFAMRVNLLGIGAVYLMACVVHAVTGMSVFAAANNLVGWAALGFATAALTVGVAVGRRARAGAGA